MLSFSLSTGKMHAIFFSLEICVSGMNWSTNEKIIWKINMNFGPQNYETNERTVNRPFKRQTNKNPVSMTLPKIPSPQSSLVERRVLNCGEFLYALLSYVI